MPRIIQQCLKNGIDDINGRLIAQSVAQHLHIDIGRVAGSKVFAIDYPISEQDLSKFAHQCLSDAITDDVFIDQISVPQGFDTYIAIAQLPGITDDEGISAQKTLADLLNVELDTRTQHICTQKLFFIEKKLDNQQLKDIAEQLLGNKLIHHIAFGQIEVRSNEKQSPNGDQNSERNSSQVQNKTQIDRQIQDPNLNYYVPALVNQPNAPIYLYVPEVRLPIADKTVVSIDLKKNDDELLHLSKQMVLALNLAEMKAIQAHYLLPKTKTERLFADMPLMPTDCELEILAQTWSEHCKHKEFNATIHYLNHATQERKTIHSLFKTFIKGATDQVREKLERNSNNWLIKVFSDNAGVVKLNERALLVWKVETHNSPSALDPYGGAITGILGNNRDPLATGVGGAHLLFNTNVLCFGKPNYEKKLLNGQLHPQRVFSGVRHGIEDGGNKSGIPTVNGAIVFDDRYAGKPLVYCGTGGILRPAYKGKKSWEKPIATGDRIVTAGGRVGKDGIHGATFSSIEIDEHSPASAVQIGSPITQKMLSDFLVRACAEGLVKCCTDNGAGGLSSSIGELATTSNGAEVNLERVPLKYPGLKPWEIFVSESQERMTLVVEPRCWAALQQLAQQMEVEITDIGQFTNTGYLDIKYGEQRVAYLQMHFLHEGVPQKIMEAEWQTPQLNEPNLPTHLDYNELLLQLLASFNICSRENVIRQYDHEVKGKTIVKSLMGEAGKAPQDAAVMRIGFENYEGIAISCGILPRYGDIDAYQMSAGAFDEAVRQIIAIGGKLPNLQHADGIAWSVNDNFCVPDSEYNPQTNPDGKQKLAKLVQMCEALYDMATYFDIPLTSGKDSMKNDFKADGVKISVPPTVLYSMVAKINDVRQTLTSHCKEPGDKVYLLGKTYNELGGSELYALFNELGENVPKVRPSDAKRLYKKVSRANEQGLLESCHDLSDGGLAVALAECLMGSNLGMDIDLDKTDPELLPIAILFSESHSRFVATVAPEKVPQFEKIMGKDATDIGTVTFTGKLRICQNGKTYINQNTQTLTQVWDSALEKYV